MAKAKSAATITKPRVDKDAALAFAEKASPKESKSGQVPEGDVRLTANIRADLHMKLKMVSVERRTTIGDLIEEMIQEKFA